MYPLGCEIVFGKQILLRAFKNIKYYKNCMSRMSIPHACRLAGILSFPVGKHTQVETCIIMILVQVV
jgi:hypothetical protein